MKKILFVIRSLEFGGAEKSLVNLLRELPEEKYQIDLLLFKKKGDFLSQVPQWVNIIEPPKPLKQLFSPVKKAGGQILTKLMGTCCARIARKTRKERMAYRWKHFYKKVIPMLPGEYDTAVAYVGTEVLYYVADCVCAKKKYVWIHNDYQAASYSKIDDTPYFEKMDGIVSVSEDCVRVLNEEFPKLSERIHYIENITSAEVIRELAGNTLPPEFRKKGGNILSIGRLSKQKGFDLAIQACAILKKMGVDFCWYVIGEGDQKEVLTQMIRQYDVADCFCLLGTRSNPYPYIRYCTFLAQPSRFEGKSVVLDEAKILGAPILATAYPTVADQIVSEKEGLIVPLSPEGIAQGICTMLENNSLCQAIREQLTAGAYGNQSEVQKYMELLDA